MARRRLQLLESLKNRKSCFSPGLPLKRLRVTPLRPLPRLRSLRGRPSLLPRRGPAHFSFTGALEQLYTPRSVAGGAPFPHLVRLPLLLGYWMPATAPTP